jgi:putative thiamine transport system permease protein
VAAPLRSLKLNAWSQRTSTAQFARLAVTLALASLVLLPLAAILWACIASAWSLAAWTEVASAPHLWPAWRMTLWTGLASTALAYGLCAWLLSRCFALPQWSRVVRALGPMLAVPHAAFAVGLVFLIAPSGWLLRAISPWLTGFTQPPAWPSSQDPWGLGMVAVLALKEVPFLLWGIATQLQRDDVGQRLARELLVAQTMGYARHSAFWQVVWPQLVPRLRWPLLAVLAYGLTVVDVAQIAGPSNPSTLSVLAWQWLQDADQMTNAQGAIAGWLLAGTVLLCALLWAMGSGLAARHRRSTGRRGRDVRAGAAPSFSTLAGTAVLGGLLAAYGAVLLALLVGSVSGVWPFPQFLPLSWSLDAWRSVWGSTATLGTTLTLAVASTLMALVWAIAWLERAPLAWDKAMRWPLYLPLLVPSVLWVVGLHKMALLTGNAASWSALIVAHALSVVPYVVIALSPAYLGFDARYAQVSASLGRSNWAFLLQVKWPMLRASISSAAAVGVAVSVAQYLPTLYVGEGRFGTVTTEAVTLASGGQRSLVAAYAWLQWFIPVVGFAIAAWIGKPRRFTAPSLSKTLELTH